MTELLSLSDSSTQHCSGMVLGGARPKHWCSAPLRPSLDFGRRGTRSPNVMLGNEFTP